MSDVRDPDHLLAACAKCGREWANPTIKHDKGQATFFIRCGNCGFEAPGVDLKPAIESWNAAGDKAFQHDKLLSWREEPQMESEAGRPPISPNAQGVDGKTQSEKSTQEAETQCAVPPQAEGRPERPEGARWGNEVLNDGAN
jgi:hypothetical protein